MVRFQGDSCPIQLRAGSLAGGPGVPPGGGLGLAVLGGAVALLILTTAGQHALEQINDAGRIRNLSNAAILGDDGITQLRELLANTFALAETPDGAERYVGCALSEDWCCERACEDRQEGCCCRRDVLAVLLRHPSFIKPASLGVYLVDLRYSRIFRYSGKRRGRSTEGMTERKAGRRARANTGVSPLRAARFGRDDEVSGWRSRFLRCAAE